MIFDYLLKYHLQQCFDIIADPDLFGYFSVKIDFMKLFETHPDIGDKILCSPIKTLPLCHQALFNAQKHIIENDSYKSRISQLNNCSVKSNVQARFFGLPVCPELHRTIFPKNVDLGCFLKVTGTVVRVTQSKMLEYNRQYVCAKCKYENMVVADFEHRYVLKAPLKCGNQVQSCKCSTFNQVNLVSREYCKDYQEIKIQEQVNKLSIGTIPGSMWVTLEDDLVDSCKPGDDVHICGTVRRRWRPLTQSKKCEVELVFQANYLEVCNAQRAQVIATAPDVKGCFDDFWIKYEACPLNGRDKILASVCPQVYGLHLVKLALLLTVITGSNYIADNDLDKVSADDKHNSKVRGQCHLLLVGDPGTGKSQLLQAGVDLTPRSVFTSGAGSTRAGLTCSALREEGEWHLEAGALVLSDGGVCCIDEIGQLREHDRTSIHEAMEQQTISIAKAGIVCKLNTRCAIVAACNPKGHYDIDLPLSANVSLATPLLSRFDLIFILLDTKNREWDKLVSSYILFGDANSKKAESKTNWSLEKLQMYIGLVGPRSSKMTKSAIIILQTYYMNQRKSENRDPSRTTVRMLDSLVRLSQAHCRLMYRTTILTMDAIVAVSLVDLSMQDCTLSDTVDALHSTTPKYPDYSYLRTAKMLLTKLNLYEIWQEELLYYAKLMQVDHKTLQNDIDKGTPVSFAKFEDITDDNIPLSSSLVTSSYFKKEKVVENNDFDFQIEDSKADDVNINKKLVATLKKHSTLNKRKKKPSVLLRNKRKRKEVTVETDTLNKKPRRSKKPKKTNDLANVDTDNDVHNILKAIPSVNDVFGDLDIDFNYSNCDSHNDNSYIENDSSINANSNKDSSTENIVEVKKEVNASLSKDTGKENEQVVNSERNNFISKLKQFQFERKHDLSKYEEKVKFNTSIVKAEINVSALNAENKSVEDSVVLALNEDHKSKSIESVLSKKSTVSSSQISIFESSDIDIDLEI